jgi:hypothetical protein
MTTDNDKRLERRVVAAAEAALAAHEFVTAIDVFLGLGWLPASGERAWRQGRIPHLEAAVTTDPRKVSRAMLVLRSWAQREGLEPSETAYVAHTRGRQALRFSQSGDPTIERAYRTHWISPRLSERQRERLGQRQGKAPDLVVIWPIRDWACGACGGTGDLLIMDEPGPLCLTCAEMDHLVYLPAGDAALTRRAKAASRLSAVVVRFSRSRKRYERQGILVEEEALATAEQRCLADEDARARRRERDAQRRAGEDLELQSASRGRSPSCSRAAPRRAPTPSPATPPRAGADAWGAAPRGAPRIRGRSSSP